MELNRYIDEAMSALTLDARACSSYPLWEQLLEKLGLQLRNSHDHWSWAHWAQVVKREKEKNQGKVKRKQSKPKRQGSAQWSSSSAAAAPSSSSSAAGAGGVKRGKSKHGKS